MQDNIFMLHNHHSPGDKQIQARQAQAVLQLERFWRKTNSWETFLNVQNWERQRALIGFVSIRQSIHWLECSIVSQKIVVFLCTLVFGELCAHLTHCPCKCKYLSYPWPIGEQIFSLRVARRFWMRRPEGRKSQPFFLLSSSGSASEQ